MIGWYVVAQESTAGLARIQLLLGPFGSCRAASMMCDPVRRYLSNDNLSIRTHKLSRQSLPPGRLDLAAAVDADWIKRTIRASVK